MKFLYRMQLKYGKYSIKNLMMIIVVGQLFVFFADLLFADYAVISWFSFNRALILSGQVWRIITFIFVPDASGILFLLLSLYFYYMIGGALENAWGSYIFNVFYFIGVLFTIAAGFITGSASNQFLNLSLFFAFAILYPDYQILLFFVLPIKMKYLAIANALLYIYYIIIGSWPLRMAIIAALANVMIFFGGQLFKGIRDGIVNAKRRREFDRQMKNNWR